MLLNQAVAQQQAKRKPLSSSGVILRSCQWLQVLGLLLGGDGAAEPPIEPVLRGRACGRTGATRCCVYRQTFHNDSQKNPATLDWIRM